MSAHQVPSHRTRLAVFASFGFLCLLLIPVLSLAKEKEDRDDRNERNDRGARLTLPIAGSAGLAKFTGNLTIQRFVQVNGQIKAVGMIKGTLFDAAGVPLGTAVRGPLMLPVTLSPANSPSAAVTHSEPMNASAANMDPAPAIKRPILLLFTAPPAPQNTCQALNLSLGAISFNVAGLTVNTAPLDLILGGTTGGTNALGTLVCNILTTLTNVANLLNLLNQLLGLLGGVL